MHNSPNVKRSDSRYFVSAAGRSSGKTLVCIGLARAACKRQLNVQTFKKGPDFIDPQWLALASGRACYNLDPYLQSRSELCATARDYSADASITLIEGTMGLHDGMAEDGSDSNAAIARLLGAAVVLVMDCRGMHRTLAALVNGLQQFDPDVKFAGILLNRLRSQRHEQKICRAITEHTEMTILGAIPETCDVRIEERELGLVPAAQINDAIRYVDSAASLLEENCNLDTLFPDKKKGLEEPVVDTRSLDIPAPVCQSQTAVQLSVGIARDAAFNFYYADDLDKLRQQGVLLIDVSPVSGNFPSNLDGLLIGGGFPERYAQALSSNISFREALHKAIAAGLPVRAECAGLMYLCRSLQIKNCHYPMVGAIEGDVDMQKVPVGRGYVHLENWLNESDSPYALPSGKVVRAHEFHYSRISFDTPPEFAYHVTRGFGIDGTHDGVKLHNIVATYAHFRHTEATPWTHWFLDQVNQRKFADRRRQNV